MYERLPPNEQPRAPIWVNSAARACQSGRHDTRQTATAPGIIAPYSWPDFPQIVPQPGDSDGAVAR
jgi:hypothetical protein